MTVNDKINYPHVILSVSEGSLYKILRHFVPQNDNFRGYLLLFTRVKTLAQNKQNGLIIWVEKIIIKSVSANDDRIFDVWRGDRP